MNRIPQESSLVDRFPALRTLERKPPQKEIPFVQQLSVNECGAACLAMSLASFGKDVPLDEISELLGAGRDGSSALDLLRAARWYDLRGRGVKVELDALAYLKRGAILHWGFSHFVVFDRLRRNSVEIVDPACGRRLVSMEEFSRSFTGVALTLEPAPDFSPGSAKRGIVWCTVRHLIRYSGLFSRISIISLLLQLFALAVPLLIGMLVDRVVPYGDTHLFTLLGAGLLVIVLFHFFASLVRSHLLLDLRTRLDSSMTLGFLEHLVSLPFSFFQQRSEGDLLVRVNSNSTIREILTSSMLSTILDGTLASLYLAILLLTSPALGALVVVVGFVQAGVFLLSYRRFQDLMTLNLEVQSRSQGYLVQMLAGIETLKASGLEHRAVERWSNLFVDELNVSLKRGRLSAFVDSLLSALRLGSPLLVLWFGGVQVLNGNLSLGTMLGLNALAAGFLVPISTLISSASQLMVLRSYVERIDDVLQKSPEQKKTRVFPSATISGEIDLENVSFSYSPVSAPVLNDVSLRIAPGQKIAIVGRSGAGKSTLARLILGLYQPSSGRVLYDGRDLTGLDLQSVRSQFGIVTQRTYLFSGTIRDNIALHDSSVPLTDVVEAARLACIHDDIASMPIGYDTMLIDGGGSLSGGQRQRVALARALLHRPGVLLLDEATSELDTLSENSVHRNLANLRSTRIVIAHRLSTIRDADVIFVLDEGRIVGQGSHEELLARSELYEALVHALVTEH